jgi:hypothetical protein
MVGRLALDRLHDPTRRQMRRDAQQQMDMLRPDVPLHDLDVERPTNLADEIPHLPVNLAPQHRLAILRDQHEVIVQAIHRMGGPPVLAHGRASYRKPPEGFA